MKTEHITKVGLIAAFLAVLGIIPPIPIPIIPVPITLQSAGVMLAGTIMGRKWGPISITIFLLIVFAGMPLLSGGRGGIQAFLSPTGGFLIGWIIGALVIGLITDKVKKKNFLQLLIANTIGGLLVVYLIGAIQLSIYTNISYFTALVSNIIFVPGDLIKALIAALVGVKVLNRNMIKAGEDFEEAN